MVSLREGTVVQFSNGRVGRLLPNGEWEISGLAGSSEWNDAGMKILYVPAVDVSGYALGAVLLVRDNAGDLIPMVKDGHSVPGGGTWAGPFATIMVDSEISEREHTMIYGGDA